MPDIYSALVTGSSRGIGLEFVKQFLTSPLVKSDIVIGTCRCPEEATALQELKKRHSNLYILKLDVTKFETFDSLANEVRNILGNKSLTLLVNNAGIAMLESLSKLDAVEADEFISVMVTNTVAPLMVTKVLRPLLKQSAELNAAKHSNGLSITRAAVINISSSMGSIQRCGVDERFNENKFYGYRESKAALNMTTQILSAELQEDGILVESIHPGFVITDMTAKLPAQISTEESVTGMLKVILNTTEKNKNGLCSFDGSTIPF